MGPKFAAACRFAELTDGFAAIGRLDHAAALLAGATGTRPHLAVAVQVELDRAGIGPVCGMPAVQPPSAGVTGGR
jgi:hypothetical protein